jgi:hypothetical protein
MCSWEGGAKGVHARKQGKKKEERLEAEAASEGGASPKRQDEKGLLALWQD